jgi:hypothetical protein
MFEAPILRKTMQANVHQKKYIQKTKSIFFLKIYLFFKKKWPSWLIATKLFWEVCLSLAKIWLAFRCPLRHTTVVIFENSLECKTIFILSSNYVNEYLIKIYWLNNYKLAIVFIIIFINFVLDQIILMNFSLIFF